ncbi:MAG: bifunctional oligoribonuclease/PAP phosphatase NrnA [Armatimonadota bacterium]|nr:bifunctional oligoribonuclease/PAP phosphatase NrnA [Armatimonadota bacterium]MCX7777439.1 bifunctional oligoribonuclease/PAP phosphatase NrnA [Armatimonadota bacterium]MDW8025108.1 bifunctional oligoribonuclease/PAP phosphatase NrnA [Armatimonadota bacterium]
MGSLKDVAKVIVENHSFVITCHIHPEGDGIGSMLALMYMLNELGKRCEAVCSDGVPTILRFLPGSEHIKLDCECECDVIIALDVSRKDRLAIPPSSLERLIEGACLTVCIDHHIVEQPFGDVAWVDKSMPATGLMIYKLFKHMAVDVTPQVATCLYTAIATDTGAFRFENTTHECLSVAAELVKSGADPALIAHYVFERRHEGALRLWGRALARIRLERRSGIAWTWLKRKDFEAAGANDEDTEGLDNLLRGVEGAKVVVLFRELRDMSIKVSLRSLSEIDVAKVAGQFGGGGHIKSSGCILKGVTLQEAISLIKKALRREMRWH